MGIESINLRIMETSLIIKLFKGSCGCTVPNYKKEDGSSEWPESQELFKLK